MTLSSRPYRSARPTSAAPSWSKWRRFGRRVSSSVLANHRVSSRRRALSAATPAFATNVSLVVVQGHHRGELVVAAQRNRVNGNLPLEDERDHGADVLERGGFA